MSDYISRKALLQAILDLPPKMDKEGYGWLSRRGVWHMVNDFPTIDVQPVVRAYWTDHRTNEHDGEWYCSACGNEVTICMCGKDKTWDYPFCPNCGADMREES